MNRRGTAPVLRAGRRRAAFTLVELLVASAITVVLAGIMLAVLAHMTRTWSRAAGGLLARQQAEQALDLLARDLQSALFRRDGRVWLVATIQPDQGGVGDAGGSLGAWSPAVPKPGAADPGTAESSLALELASGRTADCRFGQAGVWLRAITQVSDNNEDVAGTSAPRAVSYQIVRRAVSSTSGAARRYALFRSEVRPYGETSPSLERSTFAVGHDLLATAYNTSAGGTNNGDAGTIRRPRRDLLLANDVVDFGVRFWRRSADGTATLLFPTGNTNRGFVVSTDSTALPTSPAVDAAATTHGFPTEAELFVRVVSEEGARQLESLENGQLDGAGWWEIALAHSVVLTRRVMLEVSP